MAEASSMLRRPCACLLPGGGGPGGPVACGSRHQVIRLPHRGRGLPRTYCIRYADDFVVLHNTWEGIQRCKEAIQEWLKGMGPELQDAKTRFAHTLEAKEECNGNVGFYFLGFAIRQFPVGKYKSRKL